MELPFAKPRKKSMKKRRTRTNPHRVTLQQAMTQLIQTQADFVRDLSDHRKTVDRILHEFDQMKALLLGLRQDLKREIGFKAR